MLLLRESQTASGQLAAGDTMLIQLWEHPYYTPKIPKLSSPFDRQLSKSLDLTLTAEATAPAVATAEFWREHRGWLEKRMPAPRAEERI